MQLYFSNSDTTSKVLAVLPSTDDVEIQDIFVRSWKFVVQAWI